MDVRIADQRSDRLPAALLAYAVALALLLLVPPYLKMSVGPPVMFTLQEAVDLFTPVVVIPLAWLAFHHAGGLGQRGVLAFLVVAAVWIEGQGIHLAANAVGDAFPSKDAANVFYGTIPGDLDLWLDEVLSHWMWHGAWVALSILLLAAGARNRASAWASRERGTATAATAGFVHGAVFFIVTVEGVTTALGIPASILFLVWSAIAAVAGPGRRPVVLFFAISSVATLLGYLVWGAGHDWTLPEFSKVGLFK